MPYLLNRKEESVFGPKKFVNAKGTPSVSSSFAELPMRQERRNGFVAG
jgi:hypothetical protein